MQPRAHRALVAVLVLGAGLAVAPAAATAPGGPTPRCLGREATLIGTAGRDTLRGTDRPDVIVGLGGDDVIHGLGGNDLLCGGPGQDVVVAGSGTDKLSGGPGDDRLSARQVGTDLPDVFRADAGDDVYVEKGPQLDQNGDAPTLAFQTAPYAIHADLVGGTIRGWGRDTVRFPLGATVLGTRYDDVLLGSSYADVLTGGAGSDRIDGGAGADVLDGSVGRDVVAGGAGGDFITTSEAARIARGGPGADRFGFGQFGRSGRVVIRAGAGADIVYGALPSNAGIDLDGGPGADLLRLNVRPPTARATWREITLDLSTGIGRAGTTSFRVSGFESLIVHNPRGLRTARRFALTGTDDANTLIVQNTGAPVTVHGLGGDDTLVTSGGDDTIDGGDGTDSGAGKGGTNTCVSIEVPGAGC